jgi:hypothetical protein
MVNTPAPKPVQLTPPGPYETPEVEGFLGLGIFQGGLPPRVCLALRDGTELRIPMDKNVQMEIYKALRGIFETQAD